jgi:hypothetical protein
MILGGRMHEETVQGTNRTVGRLEIEGLKRKADWVVVDGGRCCSVRLDMDGVSSGFDGEAKPEVRYGESQSK